jgi:Flp pilus assembly protein TadB
MSWQRPYSELRASDSERERVVEFLREHALVGRLNHDELEERIGLAYAAVYRGDLERLISDLPRRDHAVAKRRPQPSRAVTEHRREPKPFMVLVGLAALAIPMITLLGAVIAIAAAAVVVAATMLPIVVVTLLLLAVLKRRHPRAHRHHRGGMAGGYG